MKFLDTPLEGLKLIQPEPVTDERGFFARTWCEQELRANGINPRVAQCSVSHNKSSGTLRGIHFQRSPFEEAKLVRCERGAIFDVAVDLRPGSATYGAWYSAELTAQNMNILCIPEGFGHGFQTLCDDTQIIYQISQEYVPDSGAGLRFDDTSIGIEWPMPVSVISAKDLAWPTLEQSGAASA